MMYRQQQSHDQYHAGIPHANFSPPPAVYAIDPALHGSPHLLHPTAHNASPPRMSPQRRTVSTSTSTSASPAASALNEGLMQPPNSSSQRNSPAPTFKPTDRALPARDEVTAESITDAFVAFILYCNPNFPLDVDTSTLRTNFTSPPKSDNKDFETYNLFRLIKKFDAKEIKTWGQLALDLGVEPPDMSKGQSAQKVQQYSVRLKRWMRATHIDAFFEYLLGKQHPYFNEIPHPSNPYPANGRDNVVAEEDLAIRALDPAFRPKRGRRRNSEVEQDEATVSEHASKQPRLTDQELPYSGAPQSAVPMSAHPDAYHDPWAVASAVTPQSFAPWSGRPSASAVSATSNLRWHVNQNQTPSTPHPMSAIPGSMSAHIDAAFDGEPKSAVTPSTARRRRRHGPAVSSAWPSNNTPGARPRGRPPANRNVQDGPFGTFPVDPANDRPGGQSQPVDTQSEDCQSGAELTNPPAAPPTNVLPEGRPGRLSLQVPLHQGGPVRLATPPALQVNGEQHELETRSDSDDPSRGTMTAAPVIQGSQIGVSILQENRPPSFSFESLRRVVASDLLRATILGRRQRLTGDEAKRLADSVLERLAVPRTDSSNSSDDLARLTAASWLGVGNQYNVPLGPSAGHGKRIQVTRFRTDEDGYEEITYDEGEEEQIRELYDLYWHVSQGGCMGTFEMKGLSLAGTAAPPEPESVHDMVLRKSLEASRQLRGENLHAFERDGWLEKSMSDVARAVGKEPRRSGEKKEEQIDWKARCQALEFATNIAKGEVGRVKQRILEQILDAVL